MTSSSSPPARSVCRLHASSNNRTSCDTATRQHGRRTVMALNKSNINVGDQHSEQVVDDLTRTQIIQYAGASGDYNPLHTDEIFTTQIAGYPTVFAHGMLSMGLTGKMPHQLRRRRPTDQVRRPLRRAGLARRLADRKRHRRSDPRRGRRQPRRSRSLDREPGRGRGRQGISHRSNRRLTALD